MVSLHVAKAERVLVAVRAGEMIFRARIALGFEPVGHKAREGDGHTPEGEYFVCTRNENSKYHLSLGLSYPNLCDAQRGLAAGVIDAATCARIAEAIESGRRPPWDTALGGYIMIHGGGVAGDWTAGCVALRDEDMEALWALCPLGTRVRIEATGAGP